MCKRKDEKKKIMENIKFNGNESEKNNENRIDTHFFPYEWKSFYFFVYFITYTYKYFLPMRYVCYLGNSVGIFFKFEYITLLMIQSNFNLVPIRLLN